ncbi:hypothetical protein JCM6882_004435 [Rhodosporidiobolus microsporus]
MAKVQPAKKVASGDSSKKKTTSTKKKNSGGGGGTGKQSAYRKFVSLKTEELKNAFPDQSGADRQAEVRRLWKIDSSNPANQGE